MPGKLKPEEPREPAELSEAGKVTSMPGEILPPSGSLPSSDCLPLGDGDCLSGEVELLKWER